MPDFETSPFRRVAEMIETRIEQVKADAVANLAELPYEHVARVGRVLAYRDALADMYEVERQLMGVKRP